jgi:hypothetical protein
MKEEHFVANALFHKILFFNLKLSFKINWLLGIFHLTTPFKAQMLLFTIRFFFLSKLDLQLLIVSIYCICMF